MSFIWSDERVQKLRDLWNDGLSASQIAARLGGVSRNGVIGKAHRIGLGTHSLAHAPDKPRLQKQKPEQFVRPKKVNVTPPPPPKPVKVAPPAPQPVITVQKPKPFMTTLLDLQCDECKWPMNDGGPFLFCGHPQHAGGAYCEYHHLVSVGPGTKSERMAVRIAA